MLIINCQNFGGVPHDLRHWVQVEQRPYAQGWIYRLFHDAAYSSVIPVNTAAHKEQ